MTLAPSGFALTSATLRVRNADRAAAFYASVVGLEPAGEGAALLGQDNAPILRFIEAPDAPMRGAKAPGLFHLAFLYPNREALGGALRRITATGLSLTGAADHAVSEAVYLDDPEGNGVELYVDRPRSAWTREPNGLLTLVNAPLDTDAIAALSAPEHSAPPVLGHVHLDVGETQLAEAFYGEALPFDVMARLPAASFLGADGYHHHLGVNTWRAKGAAAVTGAPLGLAEIGFRTDSAAATTLTDPWGVVWRRDWR